MVENHYKSLIYIAIPCVLSKSVFFGLKSKPLFKQRNLTYFFVSSNVDITLAHCLDLSSDDNFTV